jgi:hypothetical protein
MDEIQILDGESYFEDLVEKFDSQPMNINIYENGVNSVKAYEYVDGGKGWKILKKFWIDFEPLELVFAEFFGDKELRVNCIKNFEDSELIYCCEEREVFYFWTRYSWNKEGSAPAGESCTIWGNFFGVKF